MAKRDPNKIIEEICSQISDEDVQAFQTEVKEMGEYLKNLAAKFVKGEYTPVDEFYASILSLIAEEKGQENE